MMAMMTLILFRYICQIRVLVIISTYSSQYGINQKMAINNRINGECIIHKKICDLFCTSSKCNAKILCQKCIPDHLEIHPKQFIYSMENLSEIHSFDKISKMKEVLGKIKSNKQHQIQKMYNPFQVILDPLIKRVKEFNISSKDLIVKQLYAYLKLNKNIIQNTKIVKSDTKQIKTKPQAMVQQTIAEVQIINQKQAEMNENTQNFSWYATATQQLCHSAQKQLNSMVKVAIKLLDNYYKLQLNRFTDSTALRENHHEQSFYKRYTTSHEIAGRGDRNKIEMEVLQSRKQMVRKEQEVKRSKNQIKEKENKIKELEDKIQNLKEQIIQWQQKLQRQQRQRILAAGRQRKKLQQFLIKNDVISNDINVLSFQKKTLQDKYVNLIPDLVPFPTQLILSQHNLSKSQLQVVTKYTTIQIFRMSFISCDKQFLASALQRFQNLHTLELNSANITDDMLQKISVSIPLKVKHLHLVDNQINDDGLEYMFRNFQNHSTNLESLYVSYNNLGQRSIQVINKYCYNLKTLHISKNPLKSKGGILIGKYLKDLEQLFVGSTGIQKQGFLAICRNCLKMRKVSLVANQVTIEIVSEYLLGLQKLQWLDISYSNMSSVDLEKVEKLKIFNRAVQIVMQM